MKFSETTNISEALQNTLNKYSERTALWVKGKKFSYSDLERMSQIILQPLFIERQSRFAMLCGRSEFAYATVWGALKNGLGYAPLSLRHPLERIKNILKASDIDTLICDHEGLAIVAKADRGWLSSLHVIDIEKNVLNPPATLTSSAQKSDIAYLIFTSGSTGEPKGVPIQQIQLMSYLNNIFKIIQPTFEDRFLQFAELSFDLSVHDILSAWCHGAGLYSLPSGMSTLASRWIQDHSLTHCLLVPSVAALIQTEGQLLANSMPSLKHSLFCGENLSSSLASAWKRAAPQAQLRNLYGPTETTIAITDFLWEESFEGRWGKSVPIGKEFSNQKALVVDKHLRPLAAEEVGELLLSGSQVSQGYWKNSKLTKERFVRIKGQEGTWYRTGDLVKKVNDTLCFWGRTDRQLKVRGFRVEILEIEATLRNLLDTEQVAVIGWPKMQNGTAERLVGFVVSKSFDPDEILEQCRLHLPDYMIPHRLIEIEKLPQNVNGKVDYKKLEDLI